MNLIVAVDEKWAIGKDNNLLFHIGIDMQYFKHITQNKIVIMGRKTWESLPKKPLSDRLNIILTKDRNFKVDNENVLVFYNVSDMLEKLNNNFRKHDVFVIGGEQIYNLLLPYCDNCYVTQVKGNYNGNKFFPNLDNDKNFKKEYISALWKENEYELYFTIYHRIK